VAADLQLFYRAGTALRPSSIQRSWRASGKPIRVFSRSDQLKDWLTKEGLSLDDRKHLVTDAGQLIPGWATDVDGVAC
jgi:hypothetical protein